MVAFLFYSLVVISLGILVRIFWKPLMVVGFILISIFLVIVWSAITAISLEMVKALCTDGTWSGFAVFFKYSIVFYSVTIFVYFSIRNDLLNMGSGWSFRLQDTFIHFKNRRK